MGLIRREKEQKSNGSDQMGFLDPHIPEDVICNILKRLPAKSLMKFKCVCKAWLDLILDPCFAKLHHIHSHARADASHLLFHYGENIRLEPFLRTDGIFATDLEGAFSSQLPMHTFDFRTRCSNVVDGLVCVLTLDTRELHVLNLTRREKIALPDSHEYDLFHERSSYYLGFDPKTNTYKLLHVLPGDCEILTLGTNSWRMIDSRPSVEICANGSTPTHIGGSLYWSDLFLKKDKWYMKCFDVGKEKFHYLFLPENPKKLQQVQSNCAFTGTTEVEQSDLLVLWTIKHDDKVWNEHEIECPKNMINDPDQIIGITQAGEILFKVFHGESISQLVFCDSRTKMSRAIGITLPKVACNVLDSSIVHTVACNFIENILALRFLQ